MIIRDGLTGQVLREMPLEGEISSASFPTGTVEQLNSFIRGGIPETAGIIPKPTFKQKAIETGVPMIGGLATSALVSSVPVVGQIPGVRGAALAAGTEGFKRIGQLARGQLPSIKPLSKEYWKDWGSILVGMGKGAVADITLRGLGKLVRPTATAKQVERFFEAKGTKVGVQFDATKLADVGNRYISEVDPTVINLNKKVIESLKSETMSPIQFVKKLELWGRLAYSKSSSVKSTAQAGYYNTLFQSGRQMLADQLKNASVARDIAAHIYGTKNFVRNILPYLAAAGTALWLGKQIGGVGQGGGGGYTSVP